MQIVVDAKQLHQAYGPQPILQGVSITLHAGERAGLVGVNGSGKSTLARLLVGEALPDSGEVNRPKDTRLAYLPQSPRIDVRLTAREHVLTGLTEWSAATARYEAASAALAAGDAGGDQEQARQLEIQAAAAAEIERLGGWELSHRAEAILGHLQVTDLDARLGTMSGGEQRRVALAQILVARPDLAILDEPTNHLDVETVEWLERYLVEEYTGAVLLITHDRYVLDHVVQRTFELSHGSIHHYPGGYTAFIEGKAERQALAARTEANRQGFLRRELEWLRRQPKARTGKQKARIQRAHSAIDATPLPGQQDIKLQSTTMRLGKTILELSGLCLQTPAGRPLIQDLDLTLTRGQRLGVIGPNGCGKTTLLRAILGEHDPAAGTITLGKNTTVSTLSQGRDDLDEEATLLKNVADDGMKVTVGGESVDVHSYLARFLFTPDRLKQPVSSLSGGERTRAALARLLLLPANLLLLDEPTNDLDLATLSALEEMLTAFRGNVIVVTHDRWFLDRVVTDLLVFEPPDQAVHYAGNYNIYRGLKAQQKRQRALENEQPAASKSASKQGANKQPHIPKAPRALTYAERLELERLEGEIETADAVVTGLEAQLADPATYQAEGPERVRDLAAELERAQQEAARLMTRWEELETKKEG